MKRKTAPRGLSGPKLPRALTRLTSWITNNAPPHVIPQKCKDGLRILSKTLNGRSFPQEKDDHRTQEIEKGLSNCLRTTTVTKPWSYTQGSSSQNNTTSAGDISTTNHQRQNVKKYDMTNHTMKHPYVLRLRSVRRHASFHRNRPFSHRLTEGCESSEGRCERHI